ncbi:MAG: glutamate formimidoyltransferase [Vicinamibacterales bacterium]
MPKLVECVPNFSEGRNRAVIEAIADAIRGVGGVKLLDVDPGADTNRTVYTFVGEPGPVLDAALAAARRAADLIDMSRHSGAHPRIGAMDVCPIVPVAGVTMEECAGYARELGTRIAEALQVPVYFYEHAATSEERRSLANIRAGEYEGLRQKLEDPRWAPDRGPAVFNPRFGATVVGAREFLLAYNVNLNTRDKRLAHEIALSLREGGRNKRDEAGNIVYDEHGAPVKVPGRLKAVRAIGWYIEEYRQAQVSINLLDFKTTPLHEVFEAAKEEAEKLGLVVTGSELVGMTPLAPMVEAGRFYLRKQGKSSGVPERELVEMAVRSLGLDQVADFDPDKKIIEYQVRKPAPLAALSVQRFIDEVGSESPAPGGGSVSALAGSLGAALAAMVGNLTAGKKGYEGVNAEMISLAERAQDLARKLALGIDEDAEAFNGVLAAMRLPKATPEQRQAREAATQEAYRLAVCVPMQTARLSLEALKLALEAAVKGNRNSASDAGVGGLMARAGVEGGCLNALINLASLTDEPLKNAVREEVDRLRQEAERLAGDLQTSMKELYRASGL